MTHGGFDLLHHGRLDTLVPQKGRHVEVGLVGIRVTVVGVAVAADFAVVMVVMGRRGATGVTRGIQGGRHHDLQIGGLQILFHGPDDGPQLIRFATNVRGTARRR